MTTSPLSTTIDEKTALEPTQSDQEKFPTRRALDTALLAAQKAAEILHSEFYREDGPRKNGETYGKCPADDEAEAIIRDILCSAFPEWGFIGEETGHSGVSDAPFCWVVDPNDGTAAMQQGWRGAAVSIALLDVERTPIVPVLGVVHVYASPWMAGERGEDIFAWAEGCGAATRNGHALQSYPTDSPVTSSVTSLQTKHTILVSQSADKKSTSNADVFAPARFIAVASAAHRLALLAAGEGDAAVSLAHPVAHDFAAGHALVRAVGLDVVDLANRPILYHKNGTCTQQDNTKITGILAGPPALCAALAARLTDEKRQEILANTSKYKEAYNDENHPHLLTLILPRPTYIEDNPLLYQKATGCWLGQLIGDSLGAQVEFRTCQEITHTRPRGQYQWGLADGGVWNILAGQPTDDSELAMMLARSIVASEGYSQEHTAQAYAYWLDSEPFDVGSTTSRALYPALNAFAKKQSASQAALSSASTGSQANGSVMRVSPLGIYGWRASVADLLHAVELDSTLTHPHPICVHGAQVFAATIAFAIREQSKQGQHPVKPRDIFLFAKNLAHSLQYSEISEIFADIEKYENLPALDGNNQGWVRLALHNAFYELFHEVNPSDALIRTAERGGDTDTNCAIAGALLGSVYGLSAWPRPWVLDVLRCRPISSQNSVARPRPKPFWPVDALHLAERLTTLPWQVFPTHG